MEKITSFTVNHLDLLPGVYVSRIDPVGDTFVTTFDIRMTAPNREPVLNTAEVHTIEHLGATFLRNHPVWGPRVLYFGPMGCRTGFYLLLTGRLSSEDVLPLLTECWAFMKDYEGDVPGQAARDCGNYLDMNLPLTRIVCARYHDVLTHITPDRLTYPE